MTFCKDLHAIQQEHRRPIHLESDSFEAIHLVHE